MISSQESIDKNIENPKNKMSNSSLAESFVQNLLFKYGMKDIIDLHSIRLISYLDFWTNKMIHNNQY